MKAWILIGIFLNLGTLACQPSLERQPKIKDYAVSDFFTSQSGARVPPQGTVPFRKKTLPPPKVTLELLKMGRLKYDIYCSVCHGFSGHGDGLAVQRGFPAPVGFSLLQALPAAAIFTIATSGTADMPSFLSKLSEEERWAVSQYVKALQLRENFPRSQLSDSDLRHLKGPPP